MSFRLQNLPLELRSMVWEETYTPRVVLLECYKHKTAGSSSLPILRPASIQARIRSRVPPPMVLSVCQDSRRIAQKKYHLAFRSDQTWVNFDIDIITMDKWFNYGASLQGFSGWLYWFSLLSEFEKKSLKYLAMCMTTFNSAGGLGGRPDLLANFSSLSGLKELVFPTPPVRFRAGIKAGLFPDELEAMQMPLKQRLDQMPHDLQRWHTSELLARSSINLFPAWTNLYSNEMKYLGPLKSFVKRGHNWENFIFCHLEY